MNRRNLPDLVSAERLIRERGGSLGQPLHLLDETTSTNDEAKKGARSGAPHGSTWVADVQTAGRGRQGRAWVSPRGENLLFSVLWSLPCPPARLPLLSLAAGVAVCEAARALAPGADIQLKWPNDVVLVCPSPRGITLQKIAGVLVETSTSGQRPLGVVIGVGVNVHSREFPSELEGRATSLGRIARGPLDRAEILAEVLVALDRATSLVAARGLGLLSARLDEWNALRGKHVQSEAGSGVAIGIDDEGRLVVERADGSRSAWSSGEVHLRDSYDIA